MDHTDPRCSLLRYDSRIFTGMFVGGITLAISVTLAILGLFQFFV